VTISYDGGMSQQLYTVDHVANLLGLHVKTVRTYVRDGRLKAARVGKQYRIAQEDLQAFTGTPPPAPTRRPRHAEVSSIVQIDRTVLDLAGGAGTSVGTGGMRSKIEAARIAMRGGVPVFVGRVVEPGDLSLALGSGGEVAIPDRDVLDTLALGVFEDFNSPITAPTVKDGYTITRWFYDGTFNFGVLHYYPNAAGRGYVLFDDGPQLQGNHTPYDHQWFYASALGDRAMGKLLAQVAPPANEPNRAAQPQFDVVVGGAAFALALLIGVLLMLRANRRTALTTK